MNKALIFAVFMAVGVSSSRAATDAAFPTLEELAIAVSSSGLGDSSAKLVPLVERAVTAQGLVPEADRIAFQRCAVSNLMGFAYAKLPASLQGARQVDFNSRRNCFVLMSDFDLFRADTNALFSIADHIRSLRPLPTDTREADLRKIIDVQKHLCFSQEELKSMEEGVGRRIRPAVLIPQEFGMFLECRNEYDARDSYNHELKKFKEAVIWAFSSAIGSDKRFGDDEVRASRKSEFERRARPVNDSNGSSLDQP